MVCCIVEMIDCSTLKSSLLLIVDEWVSLSISLRRWFSSRHSWCNLKDIQGMDVCLG